MERNNWRRNSVDNANGKPCTKLQQQVGNIKKNPKWTTTENWTI